MRPCLLVLSFAALLPATVRAQQMPAFQDTVVITATGEEEAADAVAAATTVISGEEIAASGEATIAELLRRVTGATVLRSGLDGGVTSLFVRGTSSAHTLVLFDGVRLNSPYFGGYDWSVPLSAGVGRIEVVRGPYSALYGADAVGGVVQLVPDRGRAPGTGALLEGGSNAWRRTEVEATARVGRLAALFAAASRDGGGALENDDFSARTALLDLSYDLGRGSRIGVLGRWTSNDTEVPFSGAVATPNRSTGAEEALVALPIRLALQGGGELEVTFDHVERQISFRDPDDANGFVASDTAADSNGARAAYRLAWSTQRVTVGAEWRRDAVTDASSYGVTLDSARVTTRSLFAQDAVTLGKHLSLLVGVRWDEAVPWGDEVSPRVVASWHTGATRGWLSYGRAFRAPSLGELYYPLSGNAELAPERSRSAEAGISAPMLAGALRLDLVGFRNRIDDLIDFDFASFRFANVARAAQDGIELTAAAQLGGTRWLALGATWLDARDDLGLPLLRRPEWSGSATLASPLFGAVGGELSAVWVGSRDDLDPVTYGRVRQPGFVTLDAAVAVPVAPWLTLRLRADNLADRAYEEVRGYPNPGRRFFLAAALASR
jgi:vitamin B12 transporter